MQESLQLQTPHTGVDLHRNDDPLSLQSRSSMISIQNLYYTSLCATVGCSASESLTDACRIMQLNLAITLRSHKTNASGGLLQGDNVIKMH